MTRAIVAVRAEALTKTYGSGDARVTALDGVDVPLHDGEFTAIMGPSGSGKSTLLHCLAALERPDGGRVWLADIEVTSLGDDATTRLRRDHVGFVFQAFNLVPSLTAKENIELPFDLAGRRPDRTFIDSLIDRFGVRDRLQHLPSQLSGGQQQRVACVRALATRPAVVFADEPTGSLDSRASAEVLSFLRDSVDTLGQAVVMVTHDPYAAARADRVLFLVDGRIVDDVLAPTAETLRGRLDTLAGDSGAR